MAARARREVHRRLIVIGVLAAAMVSAPVQAPASSTAPERAALAPTGPCATLLFSRTELAGADHCGLNTTNLARPDTTVAPYLSSLGLRATGTLVPGKTKANALTCTHNSSSM